MISRSGIHALRALSCLSRLGQGEYAGANLLAKEIDAPENYLGKLLQTLSRSGLVESRKGTGGGFRLAREAQAIPLYEILDAVENVSRWNGCFLGSPDCSDDSPCAIHDRWGPIKNAYLEFLAETTVADVAAGEDRLPTVPGPAAHEEK